MFSNFNQFINQPFKFLFIRLVRFNLYEIALMVVLSSFLCKIFISQFLKEWQILTHFSDRV